MKKIYFIVLGWIVLVSIFAVFFVKKYNLNEEIESNKNMEKVTADLLIYRDDNLTVELRDGDTYIGEMRLKSHRTYDSILKVPSGTNGTIIWYEFYNFSSTMVNGIENITFINVRTGQPVRKDYALVYLRNGEWVDYNSRDIPTENITIGVKTILGLGEVVDVQFQVLNNILDRHAVVLGASSGFVSTAPVDDPAGTAGTIDARAADTFDTSPANATGISAILWWCNDATEEANFEVGLYAADGAVVPGEAGTLIYSNITNAKGTTAGWKSVSVDWAINGSTGYWLAVQLDNTATTTNIDVATSGGSGLDLITTASLPNPFGGGAIQYTSGMAAIVAVYTTGGADTTPPTYSNAQTNNTQISLSTNFSLSVNDNTALQPNGYYIFSTNNTGTWTNDSAVNFTATPEVINTTKVLNDTQGISIGYRWYLFDNASNMNDTGILNLITTGADTCTYSGSGNWDVLASDNCVIDADVDLLGNNFSCTDFGSFSVNNAVKIYNWTYKYMNKSCYYHASGSGGFY